MRRRRVGLLALLALAIPLPALALDEGGSNQGAASLSVAASLDHCGIASSAITCKIDASWTAIEHADTYMVSVTRSDDSVIDFGATGAAMTSMFVPYSGPGSYTVVVEAWGTPPQEDEPELITRAQAMSTAGAAGGQIQAAPGKNAKPPGNDRDQTSRATGTTDPAEAPAEEPACDEVIDPESEAPIDPGAGTIPACPTPPPAPSPSPPKTFSTEDPEGSSQEASG